MMMGEETHSLRTWLSYICFKESVESVNTPQRDLSSEGPMDPLQWELMVRNVSLRTGPTEF